MDITGVHEHDIVQVGGCVRGIDRPLESLFYQVRQVAAVVDVGMGEDDSINLLRREGK